MRETLAELHKAVQGLVVMYGDLEEVYHSLSIGQVPLKWQKVLDLITDKTVLKRNKLTLMFFSCTQP